jgi:hypothetical protein
MDNLASPVNYLAFTGSDAQATEQFASALAGQLNLDLLSDPQNDTIHQAGQTLSTWLEFLDHRHELVASRCGNSSDQFTVADFWTNEVLAACRIDLTAPELRIFQHRWNELKFKITQPKLLIYLTASKSDPQAAKESSTPTPTRTMTRKARFTAELDKIVSKPAPCPVVRMHTDDPRTLEELAAAIECLNSNTHPSN